MSLRFLRTAKDARELTLNSVIEEFCRQLDTSIGNSAAAGKLSVLMVLPEYSREETDHLIRTLRGKGYRTDIDDEFTPNRITVSWDKE